MTQEGSNFNNSGCDVPPINTMSKTEQSQYKAWKEDFVLRISKKTKVFDKAYPGHGGTLLDLHDILADVDFLEQFLTGIEKVILTEICASFS